MKGRGRSQPLRCGRPSDLWLWVGPCIPAFDSGVCGKLNILLVLRRGWDVGNEPGDSLNRNHKGLFVGGIPSFQLHQQAAQSLINPDVKAKPRSNR